MDPKTLAALKSKREEREAKGKSLEERVADLEAWRSRCMDEPKESEGEE